ncbi:hypothetical protein [Streptomyces sp. NPDC048659]|uniref:hypothetical protein n=1 Tax=Streptomyces sp. NPDC048659 TaxID=3155489 RepID=UPI0034323A90
MKSRIIGGVLLAGAMALGSAGVAAADGPVDADAQTTAPTATAPTAPTATAPTTSTPGTMAQSAPAVGEIPLSGNQLSPLGTLLGA